MSDESGRNRDRDQLLDTLVALITSGLAAHSDNELADLVEALEANLLSTLITLPLFSQPLVVQIDPTASKAAVQEAVRELTSWIDENWETTRLREKGIRLPARPGEPKLLN